MTTNKLRFALRFYSPLLLSVMLLCLPFLDPAYLGYIAKLLAFLDVGIGPLHFNLPLQDMPLQSFLEEVKAFRPAELFLASIFVLGAFSVNFSKYVPNKLKVEARFRVGEIEHVINKFFSEEQQKGSFESSWKDLLSTYDEETYARVTKHFKDHKLPGIPKISKIPREHIQASGVTEFNVEREGLLHYRMLKCTGHLDYKVTIPLEPPFEFTEKFALLDKHDIKPLIRELLRWPPFIILKSEFMQDFSIPRGLHAAHDHIIIAMTRLTLLPFPVLSSTLYLWGMKDGRLIPIGYGNYYELSDEIGSTAVS